MAPTGFYRAAWNGCEAASAWLSAKCKSVVQGSTQIRLEVGDGRQVVRARSQFVRHKRGGWMIRGCDYYIQVWN